MSSMINQDSILSGKVSTQEVPLSGKVSTKDVLLSGKVATLETLIGPPGPPGPKGDPGDSYTVKGLYTTLSALQSAHPTGSEGDAWFVGTSDSNVVYQWDVDQSAWVNVGALKGPKGDTGENGTKWWAYDGLVTNILGKLLISKKYLPTAVIGDYVLVTRNDAGVVYTITGETESDDSWVVKMECILKGDAGSDGITPTIGANGNWHLGTTDTGKPSRGASGEKGEDGVRGLGWYQDVVTTSTPQIYMWTVGSLAPKWGEGDWLYDPDNGNVGLCTSRTDKADGSGSASIAYKGTLKGDTGKDGTKWWAYAYPIGITAALEKIMSKSNLPDAAIGDYVLHTMSNAGIVFEITGETTDGSSWVVKEKCTLKGTDGTTPHIGDNGNWYIGDTDTGVSAGGASRVFNVTVVTGTGPDSLSADKTFAEIKSAYTAGNTIVVRQGSALYELTYMSDVRAEFTRVNETYYDVLSCTNSGAPQEVDIWQLNRTKRLNYDTKYRDIGLKTVPVAIKELQDKSAPTVTDSDAGKYLHVNASTKKLEWAEVKNGGSGLPAVTAADAGKFLRVNGSGSWVAETVANANGGEF